MKVLLSNNFFFISMNGYRNAGLLFLEFYARRDYFMTESAGRLNGDVQKEINQNWKERVEKRP